MSSVDRTSPGHGRQASTVPAPTSVPEPTPLPRERPPKQAGAAQAPTVSLDQPFDADALFSLRSAVAAHATELGAQRAVDDAILVAHELASNAVRHGGGSGRLRLWRAGGCLYCQVSDSGLGLDDPEQAGTSRPSPSVPGGRGLWIARRLSELRIDSGPDGTTVTAAITLPDGTR